MGDPKKPKKKYDTPTHPWQRVRMDEEKPLMKEYGMRNKKELWIFNSKLRTFKAQAKKFSSLADEHSLKQKDLFMKKLARLGLIDDNASLDDVLGLQVKDIMDRRLQTLVVRKKLASTPKQARQFIVHNHISVGGRKLSVPGYLVRRDEEGSIAFAATSSLSNPENPEIVSIKNKKEKPVREPREKPRGGRGGRR